MISFFLKSLFSVNITTSSERQCSFLLSQVIVHGWVDCSGTMEGDNLKVLNSYSRDDNFPAQVSQVTVG